jgi:hypothetical protein
MMARSEGTATHEQKGVTYKEPLAISVRNEINAIFAAEKNADATTPNRVAIIPSLDYIGMKLGEDENRDCIQIREERSKQSFWGRMLRDCCTRTVPDWPAILGDLHVKNRKIGAAPERIWILEVYGTKNIPIMQKLAEKLNERYHVPINIEKRMEKEKIDVPYPEQ